MRIHKKHAEGRIMIGSFFLVVGLLCGLGFALQARERILYDRPNAFDLVQLFVGMILCLSVVIWCVFVRIDDEKPTEYPQD